MTVPHIDSRPRGPRRLLLSWKEIAAYLGTSVRTAHRWKEQGLPTHQARTGHPLAYSDELDEWLAKGPPPVPVKRGRRLFLAAIPLALLIPVLVWLLASRSAPSRLAVQDRTLRVLDDEGSLCWEYLLPEPVKSSHWGLGVIDPPVSLIEDLDRDGHREVLYNFLPSFDSPSPGKLYCFDSQGKLRWQISHGRELDWKGKRIGPDFVAVILRAVQVGERPLILVVAGHKRWSVCQVALLDPANGQPVEEFWHPGTITHALVLDLDGDRRLELVLAGLNNPGQDPGRACLAVLGLPFSRVHIKAESLLSEFSSGGPSRYVLFPRSDLSYRLGVMALVQYLWIDPPDAIHVVIRSIEGMGALTYLFNYAGELREYHWTADLAYAHDRLAEQGQLDHRMTAEEITSLGRVLSFDHVPDGNDPRFRDSWPQCDPGQLR